MKNVKDSSRKRSTSLRSIIYEVRRPSYTQVMEARALAHKLMGIPDLLSTRYVNKERRAVMKIASIIRDVSIYIEESSRGVHDQELTVVRKRALKILNDKIEASNEYRKRNGLLLFGLPNLKTIKQTDLAKVKNLVVVLQCKTCHNFLANNKEKQAEKCTSCTSKTRKSKKKSSSSTPSFYSKDHLKSSTPSRIEKGMNENIHTYYAKPKRLEVSHR